MVTTIFHHALPTLRSPTCRTFTTTAPLSIIPPTHTTVPPALLPTYPYGPFRWFKQANSGLYGLAKIRTGNTVAPKWGVKKVTRWKPNVHMKRLWSPLLGKFIRTKMTSRVLRTVDKLGGIDNYLLTSKTQRIRELGPAGWALRWKVMQSPLLRQQWAGERAKLGLEAKEEGTVVWKGGKDYGREIWLDEAGVEMSAERMREVEAMLAREEVFDLGGAEARVNEVGETRAALAKDDDGEVRLRRPLMKLKQAKKAKNLKAEKFRKPWERRLDKIRAEEAKQAKALLEAKAKAK